MQRGSTARVTIKVEPIDGFTGKVDLLASLLYDTTTKIDPPAVPGGSGTAILSISPASSAIKGKYLISVSGVDDGVSHSITINVNVK